MISDGMRRYPLVRPPESFGSGTHLSNYLTDLFCWKPSLKQRHPNICNIQMQARGMNEAKVDTDMMDSRHQIAVNNTV